MKKILIALIVTFLLPLFASADTNQTCRNDSIVSYTPTTQTSGAFTEILYYVKKNVKITSLEAYINGDSRPVEYRDEGEYYRAKVRIPSDISGDVVAGIGVGRAGGCNKLIWFAFNKTS